MAGRLRLPLWVFKPQPASPNSLLHWHMKIAFLTTDLAAHCLAFAASSTAAFDDIHALRERAAVRYRSLQPASTPG
jgi:hypothetical protein